MADLYGPILDAVVAKLTALNLEGIGQRVYRQKVPDDLDAVNLPVVIVSYWQEAEDHRNGSDWKADVIGYPVLVRIYEGTIHENNPTAEAKELAWRGQIDDGLRFQRLVGVPEVTTCIPEPRAVLESALFDSPDLQRSSCVYRFLARRARGAT